MGNPAGLLLFGVTALGILGLLFVAVPGFEYMIGAATDTGDASVIGVIAWIFVLWITTGFFVSLTIGSILGALVITFGD